MHIRFGSAIPSVVVLGQRPRDGPCRREDARRAQRQQETVAGDGAAHVALHRVQRSGLRLLQQPQARQVRLHRSQVAVVSGCSSAPSASTASDIRHHRRSGRRRRQSASRVRGAADPAWTLARFHDGQATGGRRRRLGCPDGCRLHGTSKVSVHSLRRASSRCASALDDGVFEVRSRVFARCAAEHGEKERLHKDVRAQRMRYTMRV